MYSQSVVTNNGNGKVIVVSDSANECQEDLLIRKYLKKAGFSVEMMDPGEFVKRGNFDNEFILARDFWPDFNEVHSTFEQCKSKILELARNKRIPLWNSADGRGDQKGKSYLVDLYNDQHYRDSVIPSAYFGEASRKLPEAERYVIKPTDGLSSIGIRIATAEDLKALEEAAGDVDARLIVQPEIKFEAERSFYFIDGQFQYCLDFRPSKIPGWPTPELVQPSEVRLEVAEEFVRWNTMSRGVQRIDTVVCSDGTVKLLEIEDFTPYLSLTELPTELRKQVLDKIVNSVREARNETF